MKYSPLIKSGFLAAFAVLASIIFMSHWFLSQWSVSEQREAYTFKLIQELDRLLYSLRDVRNSQRDFAKTGKPEYLGAYQEATRQVERELDDLDRLARQHPRLQNQLVGLGSKVRSKLAQRQQELDTAFGAPRAPGSGGNPAESRALTDEIRREVAAAQNAVVLELRELSATQARDVVRVQRLLVGSCLIIFLLICLVYLLIRRDHALRLERETDLVANRDQLDLLVQTRTAELANANEHLQLERQSAEQARRDLSVHQDEAREQERLALARELHDEIGQNLTALKMDLSWIERRYPPDPELAARLGEMFTRTDQLIDTTRHISAELRPPMLDNLGLTAALEWQASDFCRRSGIECDVSLDEAVELAPLVATNLLRIFQEALTNIARHAEASQLFISLRKRSRLLVLEISDNGRGIRPEQRYAPSAYGIRGMQERAQLCGGELSLEGEPGGGSTLRLTVPLGTAGGEQP